MHDLPKPKGVFFPEDLKEMSEELDRGDVPGESATDREGRAEAILCRADARPSRPYRFTDKAPPELSARMGR